MTTPALHALIDEARSLVALTGGQPEVDPAADPAEVVAVVQGSKWLERWDMAAQALAAFADNDHEALTAAAEVDAENSPMATWRVLLVTAAWVAQGHRPTGAGEGAKIELPVHLSAFLEAGCDLGAIPDLDNYARMVVKRHLLSQEDRHVMVDFFLTNYVTWEQGKTVTIDGAEVETSPSRMRHALWMAEMLGDEAIADRFEQALPDDLRERIRAEA